MKRTKIIWFTGTILVLSALIIAETFFNVSSVLMPHPNKPESFDTLVNFRDLGDYRTEDGRRIAPYKLLRSASLFHLSDHDIDLLTNTYKVNHIIDLRAPVEITEKPNTPISQTMYHHFDLYSDGEPGSSSFTEGQRAALGKVDVIDEMHNSYKRVTLSPYSHQGLRNLFQILLTNHTGAVLWHCSSGKDRTGFPAAILLYILGATKETIYQDYMLTNDARKKDNDTVVADLRAQGKSEKHIQDTLQTLIVRQEYLDYAFKLIDDNYGSLDGYIENMLEISQLDRNKLRDMYLI